MTWRKDVALALTEEFNRLKSCLTEPNQAWAGSAPALALGIAKLDFTRNGKPNGAALHDLGRASANLALEATARGISVHQRRPLSEFVFTGKWEAPFGG